MGANPVRLRQELERLALWAGEGGEVTLDDLEAMVADTSEAIVWSLADALQDGDPATALAVAERLIGQGENVTGMIYALSSRIRRSGRADLHEATEALADLEVWCRGGADYGDELALTLALAQRRAASSSLACEQATLPDVALHGCALRGARRAARLLLAGAGVLVHGALLNGLVDLGDELACARRRSSRRRPTRRRSRGGGSASSPCS